MGAFFIAFTKVHNLVMDYMYTACDSCVCIQTIVVATIIWEQNIHECCMELLLHAFCWCKCDKELQYDSIALTDNTLLIVKQKIINWTLIVHSIFQLMSHLNMFMPSHIWIKCTCGSSSNCITAAVICHNQLASDLIMRTITILCSSRFTLYHFWTVISWLKTRCPGW